MRIYACQTVLADSLSMPGHSDCLKGFLHASEAAVVTVVVRASVNEVLES